MRRHVCKIFEVSNKDVTTTIILFVLLFFKPKGIACHLSRIRCFCLYKSSFSLKHSLCSSIWSYGWIDFDCSMRAVHSINSDLLSPQCQWFVSLQGQNHVPRLPLKSQHFREVSHTVNFEINVVISDTMEIMAEISSVTAWVKMLNVLNVFFLMVTNAFVRDTYLPSQKC